MNVLVGTKLKINRDKDIKLPSTLKDAVAAFIFAIFIIFVLTTVYFFFGGSQQIGTNITAFFGAILAFSGLMTKQYLFKETIDYLIKWIKLEKLLDDILVYSRSKDGNFKDIIDDMAEQYKMAEFYATYIKRELKIVPLVPIVLIILYGAALIACGSIMFRMICLGLMLLFVTYLVKATISSNSLAMERPDLEGTINDLEELLKIIKKKSTEHQL